MAFKTYKKGLKLIEDQATENSRKLLWGVKYPFSWKNRGSWQKRPPQRHPGWVAYQAGKTPKIDE